MDETANLKAGDWVQAEFKDPAVYVLRGVLEDHEGGLRLPDGQFVRQNDGNPGGNMLRIVTP